MLKQYIRLRKTTERPPGPDRVRCQCANGQWSIKYVNDVHTTRGSREQILGEEAVDLLTLNQRIEARCQNDFPGTTATGSVCSSAVEQDDELRGSLQVALITGNVISRIAK